MIWFSRILTFIIGFSAILGVLFLVASTYGWNKIWERFFGPADSGIIQFEDFAKGPKPNQALICPDGICKSAHVDTQSRTYALSSIDLRNTLVALLADEELLQRVDDDSDGLRLRYVQRTRLLRFPDTINIQFFALTENTSTLALYSQSQIGHSDLGVNLKRLKRWLAYIKPFEQKS